MTFSGGCQCGAVRFAAEAIGEVLICHCRMCQKATGGLYAPTADVTGLVWTRGAPAHFQSSNLARRGHCADCGTPLTYEADDYVNIMLGAFDDPGAIAPQLQIGLQGKLPYTDGVPDLPQRNGAAQADADVFLAAGVSNQHPDHDT